MDSLWNFEDVFTVEDSQFNGSPCVPVMNSQQQQQQQQQQSNLPEMARVSSGYLHEIPNNNAVPADGFFGFGFDFGQQGAMPYPNGSLSDILISGNAGSIPAMEQNPVLDLNFPAVWPEFGSETVMIPNPGSSLVTGDYSGGMISQANEDLNLTPIKEIENPPPTTNPVQFAPDHQAQLDRDELNAILISLTAETADRAKDKGKTVANSSSDELLHNIVDPYLQKEGNAEEALDLNKTPHQKAAAPKKKKYTPKVIKENKPQRGRKSTTTTPKAAAGETSAKRKYVRKQGTEAEITPAPAQQAEGNTNTQERGSSARGQQSAKRVLNFDLEDAVEAISAQNVPRVSNLYTRSSIPYVQNHQQGGCTLEDAVNINLRHRVPGAFSRSSIPHMPVSQQSGTANQHTPELGNLRFHTGTIGMGRMESSQQCNNPGAVFQGRVMNLNNAVSSGSQMARGNLPASNGEQQSPPLNPSSVWQRMLSTFPDAQQSMNVHRNIVDRTDLAGEGRSILEANDEDLEENGLFRNGFLQAMAQCLGEQHNPYEQLRTPSKEETSAVTRLHDMAGVSQANSAVPITPEQMENLKNQNAAQVNKTNNVQKRGRGRPRKIQPSASNTIDSGAIVPFMGGDGAIVPYEEKKRKTRPKVQLDPETNRVWNVLMGKQASDEHETRKKEKYWEAEREVFRGRADAFIARMHQVQGDRRFSKWKGSVVDSVVGVFLTQNVSDHLSSSVFMALASEFPAKLRDPPRDNGKAVIVEEPEDLLNANKLQRRFPIELNRRDCASSQSHSPVEEGISSQGSCVVEDLCHKSEGINGCSTSKASQASENGSSHSNCEGCQKQVEYVDGSSDGSYPPGFENRHFPAPSISSNHDMNSKQNTVERCDDESTSTSSKRPRVSENTQVPHNSTTGGSHPESKTADVKAKGKKPLVEEKIDWDKLRRDVLVDGRTPERSSDAMDTLDYEAIRKSSVEKISEIIKIRGMNVMLAERIKAFLDRLVEDHGSVDLEWLRDVPPDMAKDYLLSIRGLGLKSVECVRLLTLHNNAFPVDTNVGRIAVRLGWVPLEPLPESLHIHLLEVYPLLESVQKYLWPRLCKLDQPTLYELHYQLITFGKVFCTKTNPNCNACPMRGDCRHFASAFASAKLALPGLEEKRVVSCGVPFAESGPAQASSSTVFINSVMPYHMEDKAAADQPGPGQKSSVQPIIEEPASPEPMLERDIEDWYVEDDEDEIPTINLNMKAFTENLERLLRENNGDLDGPSMSRALVALDPRLSSLPPPRLKSLGRLRTEHNVYELPDNHYLLRGMERREVDDPSPYLLAIWTPGETKDSTQPPVSKCNFQDGVQMCNDNTCFSCNSRREEQLQIVRGTILIPCRTATKGSFPLNGTYFQVNEVLADHESSINPIIVPRSSIWNLRRRIVYVGKSVTAIFRGLTTEKIQQCFWRGFVCVRAFDRLSGCPRPLVHRLHVTVTKGKGKGKLEDDDEE